MDGETEITCPRCQAGRTIRRATVRDLGIEVYVCRQCKALWTHPATIGAATYVDLDLFLASHGIEGGWSALEQVTSSPPEESTLEEACQAVATNPEDIEARLRLAALLVPDSPGEALEHFMGVLNREPANIEALRGAAEAAERTGDSARAEGYRRLLEALTGDGQPGHRHDQRAEQSVGPEQRPVRERLRVLRDEPEHDIWRSERPATTLDDVAGMDEVKRRLNVAFLGPLRNPELRRLFGKSLRGGLLLFGPPGCGKTFIARATAGELGAGFIAVGLSDVLDMWLGESERKLHEIFAAARRTAPAVLFFDEIDALGQKRSHLTRSAGRNIVAQLLAELDGVDQSNEGVFVLGATNHPWDVDTALQRPGRFDRTVLVLPPDEVAREAILRFHLRDRPAETVDVSWVAAHTREFSGADLAHLCESAAEIAMADSLQRGVARAMTTADFREALAEIRPSTQQWFEMARNHAMFANEGGMYDDLLAYMRTNKLL